MANGSTYNYRVVVDVEINARGAKQGGGDAEAYLRRIERQTEQSSQRIADSQSKYQRQMYDDKVRDYQRQIQDSQKFSNDIQRFESEKNQNLAQQNRSFHQNRFQEQQANYQREQELIKRNNSAVSSLNQQRLQTQQQQNAQMEQMLLKSDPFQNLGNRSQSLSGASSSLQAQSINDQTARNRNRNQITSDFADENITKNMANIDRVLNSQKVVDADRNIKNLTKTTAEGAKASGLWASAFKGAFIGAVAGLTFATLISGITGVIGGVKDLALAGIEAASSFEKTTNAMTVFTGSSTRAKDELADLARIAETTVGLRLEDAEKGAIALRGLGFSAKVTKDLIVGISKQKVINNADESAIQRTLVNLSQLKAGSPQIGRDIRQMILAFPALSLVINDAFGSVDKFKKAIEADPNKGLEKLAEAMKNVKAPAGGLEDSLGKLYDQFEKSGRAFGEPILEPLTKGVKGLTGFIIDNMSVFREWGKNVAYAIQGVSALLSSPAFQAQLQGLKIINDLDNRFRDTLGNIATGGLLNKAKTALAQREKAKAAQEIIPNLLSERDADLQNARREMESNAERERTTALARTDDYYKQASSIRESAFKIEEAKVADNAEKVFQVRQKNYQNEIAEINKFYGEKIKLTDGTQTEILKLQVEQNDKIRKIQTEADVAQIQFDREQAEKRRQNLVEANSLAQREIEKSFEIRNREVERNIKLGKTSETQGYNDLFDLVAQRENLISAKIRDEYALRLQDKTLTDQQIVNIEKERDLALADLQDESLVKTREIEDAKTEVILKNLSYQRDLTREAYDYQSSLAAQFQQDFFDASSFSSRTLENYKKAVLKTDQRADIVNSIGSKGVNASDNANAAFQVLKNYRSSARSAGVEPDQVVSQRLLQDFLNLKKVSNEANKELIALDKSIPSNYKEFAKLAEQIGETSGAYDKLNEAILKHRQALDSNDAQREIEYWDSVVKNTQDADKKREAGFKLLQAQNAQTRLEYDQNIEKANQYRHSLAGINEEIALLLSNDKQKNGALKDTFDKNQGEEAITLLEKAKMLEFELASPDINAQYQRRVEITQHLIDLRNEENEAITRTMKAQIDIDRQFTYSSNRADANVAEFLASQKGITEILSDARISAITTAYDGLDSVAKSLAKNFGVASKAVEDLIASLLKLGLNYIFRKFLGGGGSGGSSSPFNIFGGGNGIGGTPNFNPNSGGGSGGLLGGLGSILNFGSANTGDTVRLADGTLATQINGNAASGHSQIFSGLGAARSGTGAGGATGIASLLGSFSNPASLFAIAIPLFIDALRTTSPVKGALQGGLVGLVASFINRSRLRKKEEKVRNQAMIDALKGIDDIIKGVNNNTIDGAQALSQAQGIRETYLQNMGQLTDKKTRNIALKDVSRIDAKIAELNTAITNQAARKERLANSVPTFASGGNVSSAFKNYSHNPLGYQHGGQRLGYFPQANMVASFNERGSEYILDAQTTRNIGISNLDMIRQTKGQIFKDMQNAVKVSMFDTGGSLAMPNLSASSSSGGSGSSGMPNFSIQNNVTFGVETIAEAIVSAIDGANGAKGQLKQITSSIKDDGATELVEAIAAKLKARGLIK